MTFDRLWSVYLESKLKIKRNKKTVTIFIVSVMCFVFVVNLVNIAIYLQNVVTIVGVFNQTLNRTVFVRINVSSCNQQNSQLVLAQDIIFVIMRIILPFIIMMVCNIILINHIRKSRNRVIRGRKEKKEHSVTKAVAIMNGSFLTCNIGVVVYYILNYYFKFSGTSLSTVSFYIITLFGTSSILLSYLFTFCQFFIDMMFNKVFRKEILVIFMILRGRRNQIEETRGGNTNTNNSRVN
jgi:hypothetical protein